MQSDQPLDKETAYINLDELPRAPLKGHMWRQEGTQLICQSCPFKHATFIEPGLQLYGIDEDGNPMIRKLRAEASGPK